MDDEARRAVERVLWRAGITGDACARVAAEVDAALDAEGCVVVRAEGEQNNSR